MKGVFQKSKMLFAVNGMSNHNSASVKPVFTGEGLVVRGFNRGSSELGTPTANLSEDAHLSLNPENGVYIGFAQINGGKVYKMAMSVGWNPYYKNTKKSIEAYILHKFPNSFYGSWMRTMAVHYVRPMRDFTSLEELKSAIQNDIEIANQILDKEEFSTFKKDQFFKDPITKKSS